MISLGDVLSLVSPCLLVSLRRFRSLLATEIVWILANSWACVLQTYDVGRLENDVPGKEWDSDELKVGGCWLRGGGHKIVGGRTLVFKPFSSPGWPSSATIKKAEPTKQ